MNRPQVQERGSSYLLVWKEEGVQAHVSRLAQQKGSVSAEVRVSTMLPGVSGTVHQARLNLTSTVSQASWVKALASRIGEIDWQAAIEQLCIIILERARAGEPFQAVEDLALRVGPRYRIQPLLVEGQANIIFGPGDFGKSYLAQWLAVLVGGGWSDTVLHPEPCPVLYLDYETAGVDFRERILNLKAGLGLSTPVNIRYRYCIESVSADIEAIQEEILLHQVGLVVVDSAAPACGGEPESADNAIRFFKALRSLRCTTLTVAHVPKDRERSGGPFGSIFWFNLARNVWEIRKVQEAGEAGFSLGLYHRKANSIPKWKPLGLRFEFSPSGIVVSHQSVMASADLAEGAGLQAQIAHLLKRGAMPAAAIVEQLHANKSSVYKTLGRGQGKLFKQMVDPGGQALDTWALLAKAEWVP